MTVDSNSVLSVMIMFALLIHMNEWLSSYGFCPGYVFVSFKFCVCVCIYRIFKIHNVRRFYDRILSTGAYVGV
jgi:hypothetical protein